MPKSYFAKPALTLGLIGLFTISLAARDVAIPEALRPWKAWVSDKHPTLPCPTSSEGYAICVTYSSLNLELDDHGGRFVQTVTVFGNQWIQLPGSDASWPQEITDDKAILPVIKRIDSPQTKLGPGEHRLSGRFNWSECPPSLAIPRKTAIITLKLRGKDISLPEVDASGSLQLGSHAEKIDLPEDSPLNLRVYRKLVDGIPIRLETVLSLSVSGRDREILTGLFLPPGSKVLSIESDLPMRIEADGKLRAQLHAGDFSIKVVSRFLSPVEAIGMHALDSLWPAEEIWSFEAQRGLRVVEISGAPLIDPSQTGLPAEWKGLPAYRLAEGDTLHLLEKVRGNPTLESTGNLTLNRNIWLDFQGTGLTCKDWISGEIQVRTRLEMEKGFQLGRVEVNQTPMMISDLNEKAGVEIPGGQVNMEALSRLDRHFSSLGASGWNHTFQGSRTTLHLPPGWKLIHASGPDRISNSWITDWSLWDVFLICILVVSVLRLAGWQTTLLALVCLVLISQESGLSGLLWLNVVAAIALWKVLPMGRLRNWINGYRVLSLALMALLWIPFAIIHARKALYPQLDGPGSSSFRNANTSLLSSNGGYGRGYAETAMQSPAPVALNEMQMADQEQVEMVESKDKQSAESDAAIIASRSGRVNVQNFPSAKMARPMPRKSLENNFGKVQSGPGEPVWNWESASLTWSGPVQPGEKFRLILLRPWMTRLARMLQALLPGLLLLMLAFPNDSKGRSPGRGGLGAKKFGMSMALLLGVFLAAPARADFPPDSLLKDLESRLVALPDCAHDCSELNSARIMVTGDRLSIVLVLDVSDTAMAPLPQAGAGQLAIDMIRIGARNAATATKLSNGQLAIALPRGRHTVTLQGRLQGPRLELNFEAANHNLSVQAPEYSVQGLNQGRSENGAIVLQRREGASSAKGGPELIPDPISPFVLVERTLILDQEWTLETKVIRVAPEQGSFSLEVPLLPFEHPVTSGMAQAKGFALASLQDGESEVSWKSVVDRSANLKFTSGSLDQSAETWRVTASSRWHLETAGLPPILSPDGSGEATWQPLPKDTLSLSITEPLAASGSIKTVENASITVTPGKRESNVVVTLKIRAGQGDVSRLTLPDHAHLEKYSIDGREQPLIQREGILALPLHPGVQDFLLTWKQPEGIHFLQKTPSITLEDESANISLSIKVPADRWTLWVGGNAIGPALLLWGSLVVLILVGLLLGRSALTPLGALDWALLFAGTSTVNVYAAAPLLVLFLALRYREKHQASWTNNVHNILQIGLAGLGLMAFGFILSAVPLGLLSAPDMQIVGNGSSTGDLRWFMDRSHGPLPIGWMISVPIWAYRLAMLVWSLWLALKMLQWLRWCWEKFTLDGIWKKRTTQATPL